MSMTYSEQLQRVVQKYVESGEPWPAAARDIAAWAINNSLWAPHRDTLVGQCSEDLARAMREEYIRDPQGRSVRAKHAARILLCGEQQTLWADIRTALRTHMETALKQRRHQIVGDCRQLKADTDSFNDNHPDERVIQMSFNFTRDLEELEAADRLQAVGG